MKKLFFTGFLVLCFATLSAQTNSSVVKANQPASAPQDTTTTNRQLEKESDMKTMDAVKTQNHPKPTPDTTSKDTATTKPVKKNTRRK